MFINSVEKFIQSLRWRVIFFLFPQVSSQKEQYGFKTLKIPEPVEELEAFENDLKNLMKNVEFKHINSNFQKNLKNERNFIQNQSKVIMAADKTTNHFLIDPKEYRENVDKNVQKEFKKVTSKVVDNINLAHKAIVRDLEIEDRVFRTCLLYTSDAADE